MLSEECVPPGLVILVMIAAAVYSNFIKYLALMVSAGAKVAVLPELFHGPYTPFVNLLARLLGFFVDTLTNPYAIAAGLAAMFIYSSLGGCE